MNRLELITRMEAIRFRVMSCSEDTKTSLIAIMDAADQNNVLILLRCSQAPEYDLLIAKDLNGNNLFNAEGFTQQNCRVFLGSFTFGTIELVTDGPFKLCSTTTPPDKHLSVALNKDSWLKSSELAVTREDGEVVSKINNHVSEDCLELRLQKNLSHTEKILHLVFAASMCINYLKLHLICVPLTRVSKLVSEKYPSLDRYCRTISVAYTLLNDIHCQDCVIRAAGYNGPAIYFDVKSFSVPQTAWTVELYPRAQWRLKHIAENKEMLYNGTAWIKDEAGVFSFIIIGLMDVFDKWVILDKTKNVSAYCEEGTFFTKDYDKIALHVSEEDLPTEFETRTPHKQLSIYSKGFEKIASIYPWKGSVAITAYRPIDFLELKSCIIGTAMQACIQLYGVHKRPMPHIEYVYGNHSGNEREFVF